MKRLGKRKQEGRTRIEGEVSPHQKKSPPGGAILICCWIIKIRTA